MGRRKNSTSSMDVAQKMKDPLAQRLNELASEPKRLAEHLGISSQAVTQWRLGQARPSLENLCKIADFYGITTDYLLGRTGVRRPDTDVRAICDKTGLSEKAVEKLMEGHKDPSSFASDSAYFVNAFLDLQFPYLLFSRVKDLQAISRLAAEQMQALEKSYEDGRPLETTPVYDGSPSLKLLPRNSSCHDVFRDRLFQLCEDLELCQFKAEREFRTSVNASFPGFDFNEAWHLVKLIEEAQQNGEHHEDS